MRVLVIGGSGFVSGTLAARAREAGHQVWVVTRGQRPTPPGVQALVADRTDRARFREVITGVRGTWDLVVDCIGYTPEDLSQDLEIFPGRASSFVFISTDFVYDPARRVFPQPEDTEHYLTEGYGGGKREAERVLLTASPAAFRWTTLRCCHIYGPGSLLGCLPAHGRDPDLPARLRRGERLRLVGGGHYLQQPLFAPDLADLILSVPAAPGAARRILNAAGPEIVESRTYYEHVATALGCPVTIEEIGVDEYLRVHPEHAPFLCHRIYDLDRLRGSGLAVPATPLGRGLVQHVSALARP